MLNVMTAWNKSHLVGQETSSGQHAVRVTSGTAVVVSRWCVARVTLLFLLSVLFELGAEETTKPFVPRVDSSSAAGLSITLQENLRAVARNTCHVLNTWPTSICTYFLIDHTSHLKGRRRNTSHDLVLHSNSYKVGNEHGQTSVLGLKVLPHSVVQCVKSGRKTKWGGKKKKKSPDY